MEDAVTIVGATGFLGRHVVPEVLRIAEEVRTISRHVAPGQGKSKHLAIDAGSATIPELAAAVAGSRVVVNLLGIKTERGNASFEVMHVEVVRKLIAACHAAGVKRFVHVSAAITGKPPHPYHRTKLEAERPVRESRLEWTILRPAVVWGPGDDFVRNLDAFVQASRIVPVPAKAGPIRPVWVGDVAKAVSIVVAKGRTGEFDLVGPVEAPLAHWLGVVADARGLPVRAIRMPVTLFRIGGWLFEHTSKDPLVTGGQVHLLSQGMTSSKDGLAELGIRARLLDAEGAREALASPRKRLPFRLRLKSG